MTNNNSKKDENLAIIFNSGDMVDTMKKATSCLKQFNTMKIENNTLELSDNFIKDEQISIFYLFAVVLGFVDSKISSCRYKINTCRALEEVDYAELKKLQNSMINILYDREEIINNYCSIVNYENDVAFNNYQILSSCPVYLEVGKHNSELEKELLKAYDLGYMNDSVEYDKIINLYRDLFSELAGTLVSVEDKVLVK